MFIRFTTHGRHSKATPPTGLFAAAYHLWGERTLPAEQQAELAELLLTYQNTVNTLDLEFHPEALYWYKPDAFEALAQTQALADFLGRQGFLVHVEKQTHLGFIIDQDEVQIAVADCNWKERLGYKIAWAQNWIACRMGGALLRILNKHDAQDE